MELPEPAEKVSRELRLTPKRLREDAIQEAWLAASEGNNPADAVARFRVRELRNRRRFAQLGDADWSNRLLESIFKSTCASAVKNGSHG